MNLVVPWRELVGLIQPFALTGTARMPDETTILRFRHLLEEWHFGMKAHIGVYADSGLVHTIIGTAANVNDVTQGHGLLHGEETVVFADAGYLGAACWTKPSSLKPAAWRVCRPSLTQGAPLFKLLWASRAMANPLSIDLSALQW